MKAQLSIEYIFTVLAWIIVCTTFAYSLSPYVSAFAYESNLLSQSTYTESFKEMGSYDLDGLKSLKGHYALAGNFTFNNTIASLRTSQGETVSKSPAAYSYADSIITGDRMLVKTQDGLISVVKVA